MTKSLLYVALSFLATPLFSQNYNLEFRSSMEFPGQTLANICGYTQNGHEYALLGASKGLIVVDVTDPDNPQQIVQIPGPDNLWKEIKTYSHYAYVTSEGGGGLQIVDLSPLPSPNLPYHSYTGDGAISGEINAIHALHIDVTKGFVYLYGGSQAIFSGGARVLDLNTDPYNPHYVGKFDQLGYIHDGYVDNDTLYACHIYSGLLSITDMSDKSNPVLLGTVETPTKFTHNSWLLGDHKHILTTDEKLPSFVTCYDISDPEDIRELDRISTTTDGANSVGHNVHVLNDWAITSWYTDGVTIVDAHRPGNLVEVGRYDTWPSPIDLNDPFEGCWGAYPFFPSGTIVTSNIDPGVLTVLTPTYVRACYLEGTVLNGCNNAPMNGAAITINIADPRVSTTTNATGIFKTGYAVPGNYTATISKPGFISQTIPFTFTPGQVASINVTLTPEDVIGLSGTVIDAATGQPLPNAHVKVFSATQSYDVNADANGQFSLDCIANDTYHAEAGVWGFLSNEVDFNGSTSLTVPLTPGYYDDFGLDLGWQNSYVSLTGHWVLCEPTLTQYNNADSNPGSDAAADNNNQCYVTGNGGGQPGDDDVDGGSVTLTSPPIDLQGYPGAKLSFYYWFFNDGGSGSPNDSLVVNLVNGNQHTRIFSQNVSASEWRFSGEISLENFGPLSNDMHIEFIAADNNPGHLVEAGVDIFKVVPETVGTTAPDASARIQVSPNPSSRNFTLRYNWENGGDSPVLEVRNVLGQLVLSEQLSGKNAAVSFGSSFKPGVYFAVLRNGSQATVPVKIVRN